MPTSKNPGRSEVKSRKSPGLQDRLDAAAKAKQAMLERFRSKAEPGDQPAAEKPAAKGK